MSHIIPRFVYKWLKETGPTGFLRTVESPNQRFQDGEKGELLCGSCEDMFSVWESRFSQDVFRKVHRENKEDFEYSKWLLKFAVSVSWRALVHLKLREPEMKLPFGHESLINPTLEAWRNFLLDQTFHPGPFEQHLIILNTATYSRGIENSHDLNIFSHRGVTFQTFHSAKEAYIFVKMCRIVICGIITNEGPAWKGTKIRVNRGRYSPHDITISGVFFKFLEAAIHDLRAARSQVTSIQNEKIKESFVKKHGYWPA